jgi:hypothetical protein
MANSWQHRYEPDIWIPRSDWTNVHLGSSTTKNADSNVTHNLNAPLKDLYVELVVSSTDGDNADANSRIIGISQSQGAAEGYYRGLHVMAVDNKNIKLQAGYNGILIADDNGQDIALDNEDWFYKPKVWFVG